MQCKRRPLVLQRAFARFSNVAVPVLTPEQRQAALAKAAEARRERAEIKARLKSGKISVVEVLDQGAHIDAVGKMKITALLEALPGVGKARALTIMEKVGIASSRRVKGLGQAQRQRLLAELGLEESVA